MSGAGCAHFTSPAAAFGNVCALALQAFLEGYHSAQASRDSCDILPALSVHSCRTRKWTPGARAFGAAPNLGRDELPRGRFV